MFKSIEIFNRDALKHIIKHENYYKLLLQCDENEKYAQFELYKKYLKKGCGESKNLVIVNYKKRNGKGRYFADGSLSLQSFNKLVRGTIADGLYYDIDMINAHCVILLSMCKSHDLSCYYLEIYNSNRKQIIDDLLYINPGWTEFDIKKLILSMVYGGGEGYSKVNKNSWLMGFKEDMKVLHEKIPYWYPDTYQSQIKLKGSDYFNLTGSTLSSEICVIENDILMKSYDYLKTNKVIDFVCCLVFDGLMIKKTNKPSNTIDKINGHILKIENIIINDMNIPIKFKIKKFETLPMEVPAEYIVPAVKMNLNDIKNNFRFDNTYYWKDFINYLKNNIHGSKSALYDYFKDNVNRVMFKVYDMEDHIIRKISDRNMYQFDKKIPSEVFRYYDVSNTGKITLKKISFKQMLESGSISDVMRFNNLDFRPIGVNEDDFIEDENVFNTWTNFQASLVEKVDMSKIQIILNHIKKVWCSDNDEYYNYILSWFHIIFTNPSFKSKVAIILKSSDKQIGKGIIINEFLIPFVFGNQYSMSVAGLDTITSKFNQIMMNKLFINCDELSTIDGSYHQSFDVLKKRITDRSIKIEIKGGRSFVYPDYCNYIMCTNNDFTIRMELGDCRYFVLDCSPCFKGDFAYFKGLSDSLNQDTANHFFTYVAKLNNGLTDVRDIPITSIKMDMMYHSLQNPLQFMHKIKNNSSWVAGLYYDVCLCDGSRSKFISKCENDNDFWVKSSNLYDMYIRWCESLRVKYVSRTMFCRIIKPYVQKKRSNGSYYNMKCIKNILNS